MQRSLFVPHKVFCLKKGLGIVLSLAYKTNEKKSDKKTVLTCVDFFFLKTFIAISTLLYPIHSICNMNDPKKSSSAL